MSHTDTGTGTLPPQSKRRSRAAFSQTSPRRKPEASECKRSVSTRSLSHKKNPEAFAPGFFFTLCNTRNLPCPTLSGNRAKSIKEQGNGRGPRSGLGKERRDILYIRSFPPHSSHQKVASCPVAWASSRKRRRLSSASVFSILCMANPAWIMI